MEQERIVKMNLTINQKISGCTDGNFHVRAKDCIAGMEEYE